MLFDGIVKKSNKKISVNFTIKFLGSALPTSPATLDPSSPLPCRHAKRKEGI
jgi:hypothetical protein